MLKNTQQDINVIIDNGRSRLWSMENFCDDITGYLDEAISNGSLPIEHEPKLGYKIFNKDVYQRRDIAFLSDESEGYKYSGTIAKATPLHVHPIIHDLMKRVNKYLQTNFNGILINYYVDGTKYISAHSDTETDLAESESNEIICYPGGVVAALAFGKGERMFKIRDISTKKEVTRHTHRSCELLVMDGNFQKDFTHEIPKQLRIKDSRYSLTFRCHLK